MKLADYVKENVSIFEVVGHYMDLDKKNDRNYLGLCPFHKESTASFSVNPVEGYWKCFGCAKGGDVFRFVQAMESCSFLDACRILIERYSIPQPVRIYKSHMRARIKELEQEGKINEAIKLVEEMKGR